MKIRIFNWLTVRYPQNYILRHPVRGTIIVFIFIFGFTLLYNPLSTHAVRSWSYALTMAVYGLFSSASAIPAIWLMRSFRKFYDQKNWMIYKEIVADIYILVVIGIALYFMGFLVESSGNRWNLKTFFDSIKIGFLLSFIPIAFFTGVNYAYLLTPLKIYHYGRMDSGGDEKNQEELVQINSQLKKEELSFYPSELIYAESDGNYVDFYINKTNIQKVTIRNSINNIEQQLSGVPWLYRTHRAFIVNLTKVKSKQGNTLGYLIKLDGTENRIPVSRKNTGDFNKLLIKYSSQ